MPRGCTLWHTLLASILALGCYRSHELGAARDAGIRDASPPRDRALPPSDLPVEPPAPACEVWTLAGLRQISQEPPPDHSLGGMVATTEGAIIGWSSSNDPLEWERPHMVRAIDAEGTPRGPGVAALAEPSGWYYSRQPNVAPLGDGAGLLAFSAGRGCELARIGRDGTLLGIRTVADEPCWGLWRDDDGLALELLRRRDDGRSRWEAMLFVHGPEVRRVSAPRDEPGALAFVDRPGEGRLTMARAIDGEIAVGPLTEGDWRPAGSIETAAPVGRLALERWGGGLVLAALTNELVVFGLTEDGSPTSARLTVAGEPALRVESGFSMTVVGDALHVLYVEGERFDTALVHTRVPLPLGSAAPRVDVLLDGAPFVADPQLVATPGQQWLLAFTHLVADTGHQVFSGRLECRRAIP